MHTKIITGIVDPFNIHEGANSPYLNKRLEHIHMHEQRAHILQKRTGDLLHPPFPLKKQKSGMDVFMQAVGREIKHYFLSIRVGARTVMGNRKLSWLVVGELRREESYSFFCSVSLCFGMCVCLWEVVDGLRGLCPDIAWTL